MRMAEAEQLGSNLLHESPGGSEKPGHSAQDRDRGGRSQRNW